MVGYLGFNVKSGGLRTIGERMAPDGILEKVCGALDVLIDLGERYDGLWLFIIDRSTNR